MTPGRVENSSRDSPVGASTQSLFLYFFCRRHTEFLRSSARSSSPVRCYSSPTKSLLRLHLYALHRILRLPSITPSIDYGPEWCRTIRQEFSRFPTASAFQSKASEGPESPTQETLVKRIVSQGKYHQQARYLTARKQSGRFGQELPHTCSRNQSVRQTPITRGRCSFSKIGCLNPRWQFRLFKNA